MKSNSAGGPRGPRARVDRERLLNDILNTGVNGALIGGFALGNMQMEYDSPEWPRLDVAIYMTSFVGVHACTCACVTSALLYRVANGLPDLAAPDWAEKNRILLMMPITKFGMGCVSYLCSVVLISFRDLEAILFWQYVALAVGLMSMSMALGVAVIIGRTPSTSVHLDTLEESPPDSQDRSGDVTKMVEMVSKIVTILERVPATGGRGKAVTGTSSKREKVVSGDSKKHRQQQHRNDDDNTVPTGHGGVHGRPATSAWPERRRRPSFE